MQVALVQIQSRINDPQYNMAKMMDHMNSISLEGEMIILFPEMAIHGYDFTDLGEKVKVQSLVLKSLEAFAKSKDICILVGGIGYEDNCYYLSQFVISEGIQMYHKIHLGKKEAEVVTGGDAIRVFDYKDIKLGVMMCYDTHFPELSTHMSLMGADIIFAPFAVPNKPDLRVANWKKYLGARAYDNRVYVGACNLMTEDGGGGLIAYNDKGEIIDACSSSQEAVMIFELKRGVYSGDSMRNRLFTAHRKPKIYSQYEDLT